MAGILGQGSWRTADFEHRAPAWYLSA